MTIDEALAYGRSQLSPSPTPQLDARLLLQHILAVPLSYLLAHGQESLTAIQARQFHTLVNRARGQEPIPYLTGKAPFFDFELRVNTDVLIPRPETEHLVERAQAWASRRGHIHIVDVGTGSGCIAIALARQLPAATVTAVDISAAALAVARQNADRLAPGRIHFHQGNLLAPIHFRPDLIVANLPYVTDAEWTMLDDRVKLYEPSLALKGGADGLELVRRLLRQAQSKLNTGGAIFLEIGWQQGKAGQQLARMCFPTAHVEVLVDLAGHDRILVIE